MSEQLLQQILEKIVSMEKEQQSTNQRLDRMEAGQQELQKDAKEIKTEVRYMWDDIKKLDERLSSQNEEILTFKRIK